MERTQFMLLPSFPVAANSQRWTCVLDPALALSRYGVAIAKQLGTVADLWTGRELWHLLDQAEFYQQQLVAAHRQSGESSSLPWADGADEMRIALGHWVQARTETDLAGLKLFWVGDRLQESLLPPGYNLELLRQWERLASTLDAQISAPSPALDTLLTAAFRDTVALSASLGAAFILAYQSATAQPESAPPLCQQLQQWGISCQAIAPPDPLVILERDRLQDLLIQAGLAKFLWAGLRLAVIHLVLPSSDDLATNPWEQAQSFWYLI